MQHNNNFNILVDFDIMHEYQIYHPNGNISVISKNNKYFSLN